MYRLNLKISIIILIMFSSLTSCSKNEQKVGYLSISNNKFIDENNRTIILNGINYVTKDPKQYFLNDNDEEIFRQFKEWGFNCIRFGMSWRGIEPEPGKLNEAYLKEIDKRVKLAEENGLWLILDMHQDLYGGKYGNGAPDWATIDNDMPHETGDVWSDAYLVSPAIHAVFDNFWNNTPASDGIGIQDHYIFVWKTLAKRYANSPSVVGFDIMNEPFTGSESSIILERLLTTYGEIIAETTGSVLDLEDMLDLWGNEDSRTEALKTMNDKELYARITNSAYEDLKSFEQGPLSSFYQKTRDAIREVNKKHIIFFEHSYFANLGVKSSFLMPTDKSGNQDPLCAYAPHGYDLVTDTDTADQPEYNRVEHIFKQIFESAKEKNAPVVIGEWGAYYMGRNYLEPATHLIDIIEENQAGQTYWAYWNNIDTQDYFFKAISRIYPMRTNGNLIYYSNNFSDNKFELKWDENENSKAETIIYIPNIKEYKNKIRVEPESNIKYNNLGNNSGYIEIEPIGGNRKMTIPLNL